MSSSTRCAACKSLRRRCPQDCVLAPYFPPDNPQRFSDVHKVFGASNITKMLQELPENFRAAAAECISMEAAARVRDPVYGCAGLISNLQSQINQVQSELLKTKGEIALHNARQEQQQQQPQAQEDIDGNEQLLWLMISSQQNPTNFDQQQQANHHHPRSHF